MRPLPDNDGELGPIIMCQICVLNSVKLVFETLRCRPGGQLEDESEQ
jgi:hypothetical protein